MKEMVEYVCGDIYYLLYVYDRLKEAFRARLEDLIVEMFVCSCDVCFKWYVLFLFDDGVYYEDLFKMDNLKELSES